MAWKSNLNPQFRSKFSEDIFNLKYKHEGAETWSVLAKLLVKDVCGDLRTGEYKMMSNDELDRLENYINELKFVPGGRYLYYAGRKNQRYNNCFLLKAEEDTREGLGCAGVAGRVLPYDGRRYWCRLQRLSRCWCTVERHGWHRLGPYPCDEANQQYRCQRDARRLAAPAIYASLNWQHGDIPAFLRAKDWDSMPVGNTCQTKDIKEADFNFPAPLDMTNISVNYDTDWLMQYWKTGDVGDVFRQNVRQALRTAEPGFSFNFFDKENETLRNACTEVTSERDSDVCNLASINMGRVQSLEEFSDIVELGEVFDLRHPASAPSVSKSIRRAGGNQAAGPRVDGYARMAN